MDENVTYTHFDIDRYLANRMTRQEMHAFEAAMMNDPFLADAVEGFRNSDPAVAKKHLDQVEKTLFQNKQEAKVVPIVQSKNNWIKFAAIFVFMAGFAFIAYRWFGNETYQNQVSLNKPQYKAETADSIGPIGNQLYDSTTLAKVSPKYFKKQKSNAPYVNEDLPTDNQPMAMSVAPVADSTKNLALKDENLAVLNFERAKKEEASASKSLQARVAGLATKESSPTAAYRFKGRIVDATGEPVSFATVMADKNIGTVADANGHFALKAQDSLLPITVNSVGYESKHATLQSNSTENEIVVKENEQSLSEVVVTGIGRNKKLTTNKILGAQPVGGWKKFDRYIEGAIENIQDTSANYISGSVELGFKVDKDGIPANIKVENSTNTFNNKMAIELLKNGPRWKSSKKQDKGNVVIKF